VSSGVTRLLSIGHQRRACCLMTALWSWGPAVAVEADSVARVIEVRLPSQGNAFATPLRDGNYQVTVKLEGLPGETASIWAEQRRLMADGLEVRKGKPVEYRFVVNVRNPGLGPLPENATGATTVRLKPREIGSASWDDLLSFEVRGARLMGVRIEPAAVPTLYLAGDSTVTDQRDAPSASWGQFITRYLDGGIAVANHAESGESLKSFVTEGRLDKLLSALRAGDWVMIQFGHNDQKTQWPQTYAEASTTYRDWLRTYIAEVRRRGATPLLVTSPERRNFDADGRIRPTLSDYADAVRAVAREKQVALIDLNAASVRLYEALGPGLAPSAFADGGNDKTHHNEYGARQLARCVIEGLRRADLSLTGGLEKHIAADAGIFDASKPLLP
jgi:lysophospholipase L1-like esterase